MNTSTCQNNHGQPLRDTILVIVDTGSPSTAQRSDDFFRELAPVQEHVVGTAEVRLKAPRRNFGLIGQVRSRGDELMVELSTSRSTLIGHAYASTLGGGLIRVYVLTTTEVLLFPPLTPQYNF